MHVMWKTEEECLFDSVLTRKLFRFKTLLKENKNQTWKKKGKQETNLSIEHVGVKLAVTRVDPARVGLEEAECERFGSRVGLVSEDRVGIDGKRRFIILQKRQQLF